MGENASGPQEPPTTFIRHLRLATDYSDSWVSTVFVYHGDGWRIAFHQETNVPPGGR